MSENEALQEAPEQPTPIAEEPRRPSKQEAKRHQIYMERIRRHINAGKTAEQAVALVEKEDWERTPVSKKIDFLRGMIMGNVRKLAEDINTLHANQKDLANVMDVNFRAFERALIKAGVAQEDIKQLLAESEAEILAERQAAIAAKRKEQEEAQKQQLVKEVDEPGEAAPTPEGATVFGG